MINKEIIAKRFSARASTYDQYATLQWEMAQRLLAICPKDTQRYTSILEIGCGTGRLTRELALSFSHAEIVAIDIAPGMIQIAQKRCHHLPVKFLCMDAENLGGENSFDLIVSNATFQWIEDLPSFLHKLHALLKEGGELVFSLFLSNTLRSLRTTYEKVANLLYGEKKTISTIALWTKEKIKNSLYHAFGTKPSVFQTQLYTPTYPDFRSLIHAISRVGASGQFGECASPRFIKMLQHIYEKKHKNPDGLYAEYEVLYARIRR